MSAEAWTFVFVVLTFMIDIGIGWWARVKEGSGFYVAGRGAPAPANGMATAADWMSAASFISMAGMISFMGSDGSAYLLGWTGGYVLLALLLAPYLRKFGKYTVPDFVGDRFYSPTARVVAAICAIFVSTTYVAGQMRGVGIVFSRFLEVEIETGVIIGMVMVGFFAVLGGMQGITWTQVVQYAVLIIAYLIPAVAIAAMITGNPIPQVAFVVSDAAERLNGIHEDLGFGAYTNPFTSMSRINVFCLMLTLMVGTAGLPHVIVRFYTTKDVSSARMSGLWALFFIAILYTTAPALAMFARYNLIDTLHDTPIEDARQLEWVNKWETTGLLTLNDKNADGLLNWSPASEANEVVVNNDIIVLAAPEVAKLAPWVVALVAAGALAAALSTASGLLLVLSSSIAHDIYYRMINPNATETRRVLVGRVMVLAGVVVAGYFGIKPPGFVAQVVALAFGLAAASFFPVILLGIFNRRMNREGAIAGMLSGLLFTLGYIISIKRFEMEPWLFGISAEGIGAVGMVLNFAVCLVVSRLTPPPPAEIQEMVDSIRLPEGATRATVLDESTP